MKKTLQLFLAVILLSSGISAQMVEVTLTVDVSKETVDATGVHVAGSFQDPVWQAGDTPMTDNGDGTWSITISVPANSSFEYKYLLGNDWALGNEGIDANAPCTVGGGNANRALSVGTTDVTVGAVCYNQCGACTGVDEVYVSFSVDMSKSDPVADSIILSGNFPEANFDATYVMTDYRGDSTYSYTLALPAGEYSYKFRNGPDGWEGVPSACANVDGNRSVTVEAENVILDAVCIGECGPCVVKNNLQVTIAVDMTNVAADVGISPNGVSVAGTFQAAAGFAGDWNPELTLMTDPDGDNVYTITVTLPEGMYQYKFLNGNAWGTEESIAEECRVGGNREMTIAGNNGEEVMIGPFCFGACEATCPALLDPIDVTFRVDMSNEFLSGDGLFVAGDFIATAKWDKDTFQMVESSLSPGIYEFTANFRPGAKYAYKFFNGGLDGEENGEETSDFISAGCGVDNGFEGSNRELDLSAVTQDIVLPAYIFNSCDLSPLVNTTEINYFDDFGVFPNPALDVVTITLGNTDGQEHRIMLYGVTGQLVYDSGMTRDAAITIQRGNLDSGLYIGQINNAADATKTFKVLFK